MLPIRPVVSAERTPVVQVMPHAAAREDLRHPVRFAAVLERTGPGREVDVAARQVAERPGIVDVGHVVDRVVEVEVVVVGAVHEALHVVDAREREAALHDVGVFEEGIGRMIRPERRAHRPDRRIRRLAVRARERDHLVADVLVVLPLHPAPVQRVRAAVGERIAVVDVDAERLDRAGVDELGDRGDQPLPFVFLFVAAAGREHDHRRAPVAEHHHAELAADPFRVPAMMFASHMMARLKGSPSLGAPRSARLSAER